MATEQEKKLAETAESADDKEDKDYEAQSEPGHQSDEGYIEDDASKAEQADTEEDEDYDGAIQALDERYAKNEDVKNLMARMDKIEAQFGGGQKAQGKNYISLDGSKVE